MSLETHAKIRAALRQQLVTLNPLPEIAAEARAFEKPSTDIQWIRESFKPQGSDLVSLGPLGLIRHKGLYLLDCFSKSQVGTADSDAQAGALLTLFPPAKVLTYSGLSVTIVSSYRAGAIPGADWVMVPVTVSWYADTQNII